MNQARWQFMIAPACALWLAVSGCATPMPADDASAPVLDALLASGRITQSLDSLAERAALEPGSDFRATFIGRDDHHSHHVVAIQTAETPHRHDEHDLLVVMLEGHGEMLIGNDLRRVGAGSILYVPRRTRHAFRNQSDRPAIAYAIYTPPFEGKDRVPAE